MLVQKDRNAGPLHLHPQVALRAVDDDQIRLQRDDALDVGIDEAADLVRVSASGG